MSAIGVICVDGRNCIVICAYFYIYIRRPCFFDLFRFALKDRHVGSSYKKNKVCMCLLV